jgi:hypothetical protein
MDSLQCCLCRRVTSRDFLRGLEEVAGDRDTDDLRDRDPNGSLLAHLEVTELGIDLLVEGLVEDRVGQQVFRTLVEGRQADVERFWDRFPQTLFKPSSRPGGRARARAGFRGNGKCVENDGESCAIITGQ